jgi:uncharacterized Zn finger protein
LDSKPELLFMLRGVDHQELIAADAELAVAAATSRGKSKRLAADQISDVFGIEIDIGDTEALPGNVPAEDSQDKPAAKHVRAKKTVSKAPPEKDAKAKAKGKAKKPTAGKTVKKPAATRKKAKEPAKK